MNLEKTFKKVERPPKEKKLEVVTSVDAVVDDLRVYFKKNKYEGYKPWDESKEYFSSCMDFLKSFKLNPKIIAESNKKAGSVEGGESFGLYLSAMIQTSYNQGNNNFKFNKVNAKCFGAFLKGKQESPIKIEVKTIKGWYSLHDSKHCSLTAKNIEGGGSLWHSENYSLTVETINGDYSLWKAKNCTLITKTLKGFYSLWHTDSCLVKIQNYEGENFGRYMKNCTIKSSNLETLELLKKQTKGRNNKFKLRK